MASCRGAAVALLATGCLPAGHDAVSPDRDGDGVDDIDDCAPDDASVSPMATERCDNGIDDDCDGTTNGCEVAGAVNLSARADGVVRSSGAVSIVLANAAGDLDGDGARDLVVGASPPTGGEVGGCYFVLGATALPAVPQDAWAFLPAEGYGGGHVPPCREAGDHDGDGRDGLWGWLAGPRLYEDWSPGERDPEAYEAYVDDDALGDAEATGDLDGDGVPDLAFATSRGDGLRGYSGPMRGDYTAADSTFGVQQLQAFELATADVDGDGHDDLMATGERTVEPRRLGLWVFGGPLAAPGEAAGALGIVSASDDPGAYRDTYLCAGGDFDRDGVADVAIDIDDQTLVFTGPWAGTRDAGDALVRFDRGERADNGDLVCDVDFDGDGTDDLLVGAPRDGTWGGAYLAHGPLAGSHDLADIDTFIEPTGAGRTRTGESLASFTGETGLPAYALVAIGWPWYGNSDDPRPEDAHLSVIWQHGL